MQNASQEEEVKRKALGMLVVVVRWSRCLLGVVVLQELTRPREAPPPSRTSQPVPGAGVLPASALDLINSADGDERILFYRIVVKIKMVNRTRELGRKLATKCYLSISCYYYLIRSDPRQVAITISVGWRGDRSSEE